MVDCSRLPLGKPKRNGVFSDMGRAGHSLRFASDVKAIEHTEYAMPNAYAIPFRVPRPPCCPGGEAAGSDSVGLRDLHPNIFASLIKPSRTPFPIKNGLDNK